MAARRSFALVCAAGLVYCTLASSVSAAEPRGKNPISRTSYVSGEAGVGAPLPAGAGTAFGRQWSHTYGTQDWERFYHYPYVYYPQNFWGSEYYRSSENLYYRYPPEMRIPVYNKQWHNYYPEAAEWNKYMNHRHKGPPTGGRYHSGHHFILDTF